jgi:hypothetical protein
MATIEGEDGYTISGSTECGGEATSTIKPGERFIARELSHGEEYWEVYLKSGISGSIPRNRIRLLPDEPLAKLNYESCKKEWRKLQSKPIKNTDVVAYSAKKYHGVANYYKTLVQASEGEGRSRRRRVRGGTRSSLPGRQGRAKESSGGGENGFARQPSRI